LLTSNPGLPSCERKKNQKKNDAATPRLQNGASKDKGPVLVPEHVPKVKDFFSRACWAHHPLPYADYVAAQKADAAALEEERRKLPRVPAAAAPAE